MAGGFSVKESIERSPEEVWAYLSLGKAQDGDHPWSLMCILGLWCGRGC